MKYVKRFEPIESVPQILTDLMHRLGVDENFWFEDVLDLKEEAEDHALACHTLKVIYEHLQERNSILGNAIRSSEGITKFLEESKELETEYQAVVESGETEIPDDAKYHCSSNGRSGSQFV